MGPNSNLKWSYMVLKKCRGNKKKWILVVRGKKSKGSFSPWASARHRGGGKIRSGGASFRGGATCPESGIGAEGLPAPAGAWGFMSFSKLKPSRGTSLKIVKYHKSQQL